jgi:hypothetical protein
MKNYPLVSGNVWQSVRDDFGLVAGTYSLRLWNDTLTDFSPITRLLRTDEEGTLYIGTSSKLPNRIGALKKAVCAAYGGIEGYRDPGVHGAGRMISKLFARTFAVERLCVEVRTHPPNADDQFYYYREEWRLLSRYAERFGEFPPLNGPKPSQVPETETEAA